MFNILTGLEVVPPTTGHSLLHVHLVTAIINCLRLCACIHACVCMVTSVHRSVCVHRHLSLHSSVNRRLNIRMRQDGNGSLHLYASFLQGLSGCTIVPSKKLTLSTLKVIAAGLSYRAWDCVLSPLWIATWLDIINDAGAAVELIVCNKE